jgi:hypothetical protein
MKKQSQKISWHWPFKEQQNMKPSAMLDYLYVFVNHDKNKTIIDT